MAKPGEILFSQNRIGQKNEQGKGGKDREYGVELQEKRSITRDRLCDICSCVHFVNVKAQTWPLP